MTVVRVASDWHLGPGTPAGDARVARAFLAAARVDGARVVLNGDVFDDLFAGRGRAEAAHPAIVAELDALRALGRLERTSGNHDPDAGAARLVLDVPGTGRVLVMHGHAADPVNASLVGRLGDGISRRFGRLAIVRGAAALAESVAHLVRGDRYANAGALRDGVLEYVELGAGGARLAALRASDAPAGAEGGINRRDPR